MSACCGTTLGSSSFLSGHTPRYFDFQNHWTTEHLTVLLDNLSSFGKKAFNSSASICKFRCHLELRFNWQQIKFLTRPAVLISQTSLQISLQPRHPSLKLEPAKWPYYTEKKKKNQSCRVNVLPLNLTIGWALGAKHRSAAPLRLWFQGCRGPPAPTAQLTSQVLANPPVFSCRASVTQRYLKMTPWDFCADVVYLRQNYSINISRLGWVDYKSQFLVPMYSFNTDLSAVPKTLHTSLLLWNRRGYTLFYKKQQINYTLRAIAKLYI